MFWKKKNLQLIYEITPQGQMILKCHIPNNFNHSFLTSMLLALFSSDKQIIEGTCRAIQVWGEKEGWSEAAEEIITAVLNEEQKKVIQKTKRSPLISPSNVLNNFRKSLILKD